MQLRANIGTEPNNIAGIGGNLWLIKRDVNHKSGGYKRKIVDIIQPYPSETMHMKAFYFTHVGVIGTHRNPLVAETVQNILTLLGQWGIKVTVGTKAANTLPESSAPTGDIQTISQQCDCVIAVGGDGNLLSAARELSTANIPVIGINRGQLGFLTDIKPDELETQLKAILQGDYQESRRFLLKGTLMRNGQAIASGNALNDIVLFPGEVAQLIEFELSIDHQFVYSQRSDGLIISTPTGSTAYALSAGGPIMQPSLNALVLVPKFPHTLTSRPIVIDGDKTIQLHIGDNNKTNPHLSLDGQHHFDLQQGDYVEIRKQPQPLTLLHPPGYDYYHVLRTKLCWGTQLIPLERK